MPRKTLQVYDFGPAPIGEVSLVDSEGQNVTDVDNHSVRVTLAGDKTDLTEEQKDSNSQVVAELRRIRRANELLLGQDVEEPEN